MTGNKIIQLKDVTIAQRELTILKNITLEVNNGEFIYLIGKTGSGKSSILKVLYAENKIKSGEAEVADQQLVNIKKKNILSLRRKLGIIFQDFQLLSDRSIADNLKFVMKATGWKGKVKIESKIEELLKKVGMENKGYKFPHQVSGGEQQRIAIARALINDPELIIADEPTGNLDPETTNEIMKILFEICSNGKTVIMATHDYDMMQKFPSRTFRCADEKIEEINLAEAPEFFAN
jgi:cell division transport system ATP-binding protein